MEAEEIKALQERAFRTSTALRLIEQLTSSQFFDFSDFAAIVAREVSKNPNLTDFDSLLVTNVLNSTEHFVRYFRLNDESCRLIITAWKLAYKELGIDTPEVITFDSVFVTDKPPADTQSS